MKALPSSKTSLTEFFLQALLSFHLKAHKGFTFLAPVPLSAYQTGIPTRPAHTRSPHPAALGHLHPLHKGSAHRSTSRFGGPHGSGLTPHPAGFPHGRPAAPPAPRRPPRRGRPPAVPPPGPEAAPGPPAAVRLPPALPAAPCPRGRPARRRPAAAPPQARPGGPTKGGAGGRWERAPAAHSPGLGRRRPPPGRASGQRGAAATRRLCNGGGGTHRGGGGRSRRGKRNRRAWPQPARAGRRRRDYGTRQPSAARGPTGNAVRRARRESGFGKSALPSAPLPFPIARSYPTRCHKPTRLRLLLQPALSTLSPLPFSPQAHLFTR